MSSTITVFRYTTLLVVLTLSLLPQTSRAQTEKEIEEVAIRTFSKYIQLPQPSTTPVKVRLAPPSPAYHESKAPEHKLQLLQQSYYFYPSAFDEDQLRLEADYFHLPNYFTIIKDLTFTEALDANGKNLIDAAATEAFKKQWNATRLTMPTVILQPGKSAEVMQVKGFLAIAYPQSYQTIVFTPAEVGQTKTLHGKNITLLSIINDVAIIRTTGTDRVAMELTGLLTGDALETEDEGRMPLALYQLLDSNGKLPPEKAKLLLHDQKLRALLKRPDTDTAEIEIVQFIKTAGSIDKLLIALPTKIAEKTLPLTVSKKPDFSAETFTIPASRYDNLKPLHFSVQQADAVKNGIRVNSGRSEALIGGNTPLITVSLPPIDNSYYAEVSFEKVKATKGGKPLSVFPYTESLDIETLTVDCQLNGESDTPLKYDQVTGLVVVKYPLKVTTRTIRRTDAPTERIQFRSDYTIASQEGKEGSFSVSVSVGDSGPKVYPVRAFDATGQPLKRETATAHSENNYSIYNYWGKVAYVEVDEVSEWGTITIPFKLAPAKK